jgi:CMD domain protein
VTIPPDIIDHLAGIAPGSPLDELRRRRPETRGNAQASYRALFEPELHGGVSPLERYAVASFVAGLHSDDVTASFYAAALGEQDTLAEHDGAIAAAVAAEIVLGAATGPYGEYPAGPLARESAAGPRHRVADDHRATLGSRLTAALEHAHLLVLRPRESSPRALDALLAAGWSATDIVTLSQLVSFLAFQIRVITGLRALESTVLGSTVLGSTTLEPTTLEPVLTAAAETSPR